MRLGETIVSYVKKCIAFLPNILDPLFRSLTNIVSPIKFSPFCSRPNSRIINFDSNSICPTNSIKAAATEIELRLWASLFQKILPNWYCLCTLTIDYWSWMVWPVGIGKQQLVGMGSCDVGQEIQLPIADNSIGIVCMACPLGFPLFLKTIIVQDTVTWQ